MMSGNEHEPEKTVDVNKEGKEGFRFDPPEQLFNPPIRCQPGDTN